MVVRNDSSDWTRDISHLSSNTSSVPTYIFLQNIQFCKIFNLETQHSWRSEIHPSSFLNVIKMLGDAVSLLGNITLFHVPQKIQICPMTMDEIECK